jgi:hypothetical protein
MALAEEVEKEKHPKPTDHAETDKELAQKRGTRMRGSKAEIGVSAFLSTCPLRLTAVLSPYCKRAGTGRSATDKRVP